MNESQNKTITYVVPGSNRPILRGIYDESARSFADENINYAEVVEALDDIRQLASTTFFTRHFASQEVAFKTLLTTALGLAESVENFDAILDVLKEMYQLTLTVTPSSCVSFIKTQLKPFIKEARHRQEG